MVVCVHMRTGEILAWGPYKDRAEALRKAEWQSNPLWHATVTRIFREEGKRAGGFDRPKLNRLKIDQTRNTDTEQEK